MKFGILTFHSQLNYGGVLQCWALQKALEKMGHEVVVIDRWWNEGNRRLLGNFFGASLLRRLVFLGKALYHGDGELGALVRRWRTIRFIRKRLHLTSFGFFDWRDAPEDLGVDAVVVGSDQVWRESPWDDPAPYLLEFRDDIRKFSYAASFGMSAIPMGSQDRYRRALVKFSAISCREREGVEICRGLGLRAAHVVDPTLLLAAGEYEVNDSLEKRRLVCYFLAQDPIPVLQELECFAQRNRCDVLLLAAESQRIRRSFLKHVRFAVAAGPQEFLRYFSQATWVLTDSYHGLMFSAQFNRNIRVLRPSDDVRRGMFARIEEFVSVAVSGLCIVESVGAALKSFESGVKTNFNKKKIEALRADSLDWIKANLR